MIAINLVGGDKEPLGFLIIASASKPIASQIWKGYDYWEAYQPPRASKRGREIGVISIKTIETKSLTRSR